MNVLDTLKTLAKAKRPAEGLLHNCRFEGLGIETYGIEAIVERIRMAPFDIDADAHIVETTRHIALFDGDRAIFADLFGGQVGRLWILGGDGFGGAEAAIAVPFDPDLDQAGGDVFFAAGDHADLAPDAAGHVETIGREIVADAEGPRARAFAIRAFGTKDRGAALYTVFRLRPEGEDVAGFSLMAARWGKKDHHVVRDSVGEAMLTAGRWSPRIDA